MPFKFSLRFSWLLVSWLVLYWNPDYWGIMLWEPGSSIRLLFQLEISDTTVAGEHELYCCQVEVEVYPYCWVGLGVPDSCVIFTDSAVGVVLLLYAEMKALFLNLPSSDTTAAGMRVSCYCWEAGCGSSGSLLDFSDITLAGMLGRLVTALQRWKSRFPIWFLLVWMGMEPQFILWYSARVGNYCLKDFSVARLSFTWSLD